MPVDGAEAQRSFSYGTGIRKYDKDDPSVGIMRKRRSAAYAKYGIGTNTAANSRAASTSLKPAFKAKKNSPLALPEQKTTLLDVVRKLRRTKKRQQKLKRVVTKRAQNKHENRIRGLDKI